MIKPLVFRMVNVLISCAFLAIFSLFVFKAMRFLTSKVLHGQKDGVIEHTETFSKIPSTIMFVLSSTAAKQNFSDQLSLITQIVISCYSYGVKQLFFYDIQGEFYKHREEIKNQIENLKNEHHRSPIYVSCLSVRDTLVRNAKSSRISCSQFLESTINAMTPTISESVNVLSPGIPTENTNKMEIDKSNVSFASSNSLTMSFPQKENITSTFVNSESLSACDGIQPQCNLPCSSGEDCRQSCIALYQPAQYPMASVNVICVMDDNFILGGSVGEFMKASEIYWWPRNASIHKEYSKQCGIIGVNAVYKNDNFIQEGIKEVMVMYSKCEQRVGK